MITNKINTEILIYLVVGIIAYFLDIFYTEYDDDCTSSQFKKTAFHITLILHHLLISFIILVCFFSTNKNLLLFVLILCIFIFIQWKLFSICIITSASKKLCNGKYKWKITNIINNITDNEYYFYLIILLVLILKSYFIKC
jgi:hypothetical protein